MGFLGVLAAGSVLAVKYRLRGRRRLPKGGGLSIVDSLSLGADRMLCLVRWKDDTLLVGVTDQRVTLLQSCTETEEGSAEDPLESPLPEPHKRGFRKYLVLALFMALATSALWSPGAIAAPSEIPVPSISINLPEETRGGLETALGILGLLTVLTLAPAIMILTTSFTRIVMVFSFLRSGLGTQQTPPNQILIGLALLLTFFVMAPTWTAVNEAALVPYLDGAITAKEALSLAGGPLKEFMLKETREKDLALFVSMSKEEPPASPSDMPLVQMVPAFAISELRTAFEMGFLIYLPFLVVDMVVASTLMAMGMLMLPPVLISLPFKILLFILVDGWGLISKTLISSFQ